MRAFVIRRIATSIPAVLGVVTLVFLMIHLAPGDPVEIMLGENASPADKAALTRQLKLDRPLAEQYSSFLRGVATFDLGESIHTKKGVAESISERYGATLKLALASMLFAITLALPLGALAAVKKDTRWDRGAMLASLIGVSMPGFWLGPMLILAFAVELKWLPVAGSDGWNSVILPAVTLGSAMSASLARLTRSTMIDALGEEYIITARAKGLSGFAVIFKHAMGNALLPVVTIAGLQLGALLGGAIITETIFAWPGLGRLTIQAINARDYPLAQGCVLAIALSYVAVNLLTDILYALIDPRVRLK